MAGGGGDRGRSRRSPGETAGETTGETAGETAGETGRAARRPAVGWRARSLRRGPRSEMPVSTGRAGERANERGPAAVQRHGTVGVAEVDASARRGGGIAGRSGDPGDRKAARMRPGKRPGCGVPVVGLGWRLAGCGLFLVVSGGF